MSDKTFRMIVQWLVLLGGPLLWFAHLGLVYFAVTMEVMVRFEAGLTSRIAVLAITLVMLAAIVTLGILAWRGRIPKWGTDQPDLAPFWSSAAVTLYFLSFLGVLWQGLPAILVDGAGSHEALWGGLNVPLELP